MTDYISREGAVRAIDVPNIYHGIIAPLQEILCDIPAADVVEVVHGRWDTTDAFPHHVYCTACNMTYIPNDRWQVWQDKYGEGGLPRAYCPNCGAKMDGGPER